MKAVGQINRFEESSEHFVVPVSVAYAFWHTWKLLRQTPEWMRTAVNLQPDL